MLIDTPERGVRVGWFPRAIVSGLSASLTTLFGFSSSAARRAITLRSLIAMGGMALICTLISPANAAL